MTSHYMCHRDGRPKSKLLSAGARRLLCLLVLAAAGGLAGGCTGPGPDGPSAPATPTPQPFVSGGLGLTKAEWEQQHPPTAGVGQYGRYSVVFWSENWRGTPDSPISFILSKTGVIEPDKMHAAALALLPADAQLVAPGTPQGWEHRFTEDLYHSATLATRYALLAARPDPWGSDPPGTIRVFYGGDQFSINAGLHPEPPLPTIVWPTPPPTPVGTVPPPLLTLVPPPTPQPTAFPLAPTSTPAVSP